MQICLDSKEIHVWATILILTIYNTLISVDLVRPGAIGDKQAKGCVYLVLYSNENTRYTRRKPRYGIWHRFRANIEVSHVFRQSIKLYISRLSVPKDRAVKPFRIEWPADLSHIDTEHSLFIAKVFDRKAALKPNRTTYLILRPNALDVDTQYQ
ncbi:hypothetical protein MPH_05418 [Macrophomina phaseolina MS6]|uniref:Uncharacterized protein n=1 Tax=Macrophomina phaseolina (strain MS6) TaxID=1126212 RepID=K2RX98_MACPH|nr:hypothetical protein MPH_05418 [Macrophomina phaseolina MS6]